MNTSDLKTRLYEQIEHLNNAQLEKLYDLLDQEFFQHKTETVSKRVGGKYKGQFKIRKDFDQMPDNFVSVFSKD